MARRQLPTESGAITVPDFSRSRRYGQVVAIDNPHVEEFRKAVQKWDDERFLKRDELYAVSMFFLYIVNLSEADGWVYDGHSLKRGSPMCTLTVRATIEALPLVVFTSGRTPMACVRMFIRKMEGDMLEWRPDQFR